MSSEKPVKSTKTTILGILAILSALLAAAQAHFDGNPETVVSLPAVFAAISTGVGLIFSRDFDVTSEGTKVVKALKDSV